MTEYEPTLGEVFRLLEDLKTEVKQLNVSIGETYVRRDVYSAEQEKIRVTYEHMIKRLERMESRSEWVTRTVGFILISAIITSTIYLKGVFNI